MLVDISFEGLQRNYVTMKSSLARGSDENKFVKCTTTETVTLCSDGDKFMGMVDQIEASADGSGNAPTTVQESGYFHDVPYSGAAPSLGYEDLLAAGPNVTMVKDGSGSGVNVHVVKVDTAAVVCSFKVL